MKGASRSQTQQSRTCFLLAFVVGLALGWSTEPAAAQTAGLVAAYSFGEGAGLTVADASGVGNTGTIQNATWTAAGRYGVLGERAALSRLRAPPAKAGSTAAVPGHRPCSPRW